MTIIKGKLATRDLQTALSSFFSPLCFFALLCRISQTVRKHESNPRPSLPAASSPGCVSLSSAAAPCALCGLATPDSSLSGCSGLSVVLSSVLTAVHARQGNAARSRRIWLLRVGVLMLLMRLEKKLNV